MTTDCLPHQVRDYAVRTTVTGVPPREMAPREMAPREMAPREMVADDEECVGEMAPREMASREMVADDEECVGEIEVDLELREIAVAGALGAVVGAGLGPLRVELELLGDDSSEDSSEDSSAPSPLDRPISAAAGPRMASDGF